MKKSISLFPILLSLRLSIILIIWPIPQPKKRKKINDYIADVDIAKKKKIQKFAKFLQAGTFHEQEFHLVIVI